MYKSEANKSQRRNLYFWRTYEQKELDLIAEINGEVTAYEIKTKTHKHNKSFDLFKTAYPNSILEQITMENITSYF